VKVSLIAAVAENGTIGQKGQLPWRIRDDMRFFAAQTRGHVVVTGRLNMLAMGRPLPGRTNVVVSRTPGDALPGCVMVGSVEEALRYGASTGESELFVIGGAQIYALALPYADVFYRTRVLAEVPGEVKFPPFDESEWSSRELARHPVSPDNEHACIIEELRRRVPPARALPG
jgi:dihydrofolate reductase